MGEAEILLRREDLGPDEQVGDAPGLPTLEPGRAGRHREAGATQHRNRACQVGCRRAKALESVQHETSDRRRADRGHPLRRIGGRLDLRVSKGGDKLAQEERVAAGSSVAGGGELVLDPRAEPVAEHLCGGLLAQRAGAENLGRGIVGELLPQALALGIRGPAGGHEQYRQPLEAPQQIAQELQ